MIPGQEKMQWMVWTVRKKLHVGDESDSLSCIRMVKRGKRNLGMLKMFSGGKGTFGPPMLRQKGKSRW